MRYFKTTFMWMIVMAAIAGYSYIDFEHTRVEEKRKDEATRLFPFYPKDVLSITLKKEERVIELERWDDGWRIVAPLEAKANSESVEKFLGYVTDSRNDADYVMDPDPTPERLKEFGLTNPTVRVTLKVGKKLTPYSLVFGDRAPSMGVAFAMVKGKKPVYRVLSYARAEADKDVYYFRDKTALRLNPVMVDQLVIKRPKSQIRMKLPLDGKWMIESPVKVRADHLKVFELIGVFANVEVKEFIAESKDDLKSFGLDKPAIELLFWLSGDAEPTVSLKVGSRNPEKRGYYCSMSDRDNIFLLSEETIAAIPHKTSELRSRDLFFFENDHLRRIEIRGRKKSTVLVKGSDLEWRKNNESGAKVDFSRVKEFLDDLTSEKIQDFITDKPASLAEYGLDPADVQLLIWPDKSAVPIHLGVGHKTPAGYVYANSTNQGDILALNERVKRILETYF